MKHRKKESRTSKSQCGESKQRKAWHAHVMHDGTMTNNPKGSVAHACGNNLLFSLADELALELNKENLLHPPCWEDGYLKFRSCDSRRNGFDSQRAGHSVVRREHASGCCFVTVLLHVAWTDCVCVSEDLHDQLHCRHGLNLGCAGRRATAMSSV